MRHRYSHAKGTYSKQILGFHMFAKSFRVEFENMGKQVDTEQASIVLALIYLINFHFSDDS